MGTIDDRIVRYVLAPDYRDDAIQQNADQIDDIQTIVGTCSYNLFSFGRFVTGDDPADRYVNGMESRIYHAAGVGAMGPDGWVQTGRCAWKLLDTEHIDVLDLEVIGRD